MKTLVEVAREDYDCIECGGPIFRGEVVCWYDEEPYCCAGCVQLSDGHVITSPTRLTPQKGEGRKTMQITMELLKNWHACQDITDWYGERPELEGADHVQVCAALAADMKSKWSACVCLVVAERLEDQTLLAEMRTDASWWVRRAVAERLENQTLLAEMRHDEDSEVRVKVALRLTELSK